MPETQARRGAALVEMGVVLPVLVLIAFGCVDFGRFVYAYAAVTNAAQEGAAFGSQISITSFPGATFVARKAAWTTAVRQAAVAEPSALTPVLTLANVTVTDPDATPGFISVSVEYNFSLVAPGVLSFLLDPATQKVSLARTVVMPRTR